MEQRAGVQPLGALGFPINSANPALCDTNPAPAGCPVPEAVPGGRSEQAK
jgi:hypothetical protein